MKKELNLGPALFILIYHFLLLIVSPFYFYYSPPSFSLVVWTLILLSLSGISITAGYHRYFSHATFKTYPVVEAILLFFGTMSAQGSVLKWTHDHRLHHAFVDTDKDPYSIKKGFWHAHILWLFKKQREIDPKVIADLKKNPLLCFQHKYYPFLMVATNIIAFLFVGTITKDYLGAFVLAWWVRLFISHHATWSINSLAHFWGSRSFCREQTAVDNYLISLITFGEGYHNYHHTFANDYRNGVRWYHFDPSKWLIWLLSKLGLAYGLKKVDSYRIKKQWILESKKEVLNKIKGIFYVRKELLERRIQLLSSEILVKISHMHQLFRKYSNLKKRKDVAQEAIQNIYREINQIKGSLKSDLKSWKKLSKQIMALKPLPLPKTYKQVKNS